MLVPYFIGDGLFYFSFLGGKEMLDIKFVRENPDIVKQNIKIN